MEHRQHDRFKVECPVVFAGDHAGTGTVYNLGVGGCKIISEPEVSTGAMLSLRLRPSGVRPPILVHAATVRWAMEGECGVEFLGMQESERDRLVQFIDTLVQAA
jgi:hypothetical protein